MKLDIHTGSRGTRNPATVDITGLTADSREVKPGYLFAALPGTKTDGARFIADALARGAAAILADEKYAPDASVAVPVVHDANPRRQLALMAARFYGCQPETAIAATGTNGKTSVTAFVRQIWETLGFDAASLGTTGIIHRGQVEPLGYTTPDPVILHSRLAQLADAGVTHLAFEASSHGLAQCRLDGMTLAAGAFTNITRDHLDYHADFDDYFAAKMRLFTEVLSADRPAVIDVDSQGGEEVAEIARARGLRLFTVGRRGDSLHLLKSVRDGFAQVLTLVYKGRQHEVRLPLAGEFQAANALVAAGLALVTGSPAEAVFAAVEKLQGAKGRLELVGTSQEHAPVFVDYAHTPDALENALKALRPYVSGKLHVVFGCGGDRDRGKRPIMGAIAGQLADCVYVTDDNPRSEDPAFIRTEILTGAPHAADIADRAEAIATAIAELKRGDVLLIAGKGHETGQIIGDAIMPYSDHEVVAKVLGKPLSETKGLFARGR
jgi:UDP-N-acetylmuramoyl-L-alanyl-D-glutamate--2,6-diaminopimelate ligase